MSKNVSFLSDMVGKEDP